MKLCPSCGKYSDSQAGTCDCGYSLRGTREAEGDRPKRLKRLARKVANMTSGQQVGFFAVVLLTFFIFIMVGGSACIDAAFPRPTERLPGSHGVEIQYKDQAAITTVVACERYYDAMCAARGNYWSIREIGTSDLPSLVRFITINDSDLGEIRIARPSCELFKGLAPKEFNPMISINGENYFYSSETDDGYVFIKRDFALQKIDPGATKSVTLPFTVRVNGKVLLPPTPPQR